MVKLMTLHMHTYVKNMEKKCGADIEVKTREGSWLNDKNFELRNM